MDIESKFGTIFVRIVVTPFGNLYSIEKITA